MRKLLLILASGFSPFAFGQSAVEVVKESLGIYHLRFPQEKVYVHHDKPHYVLGDKVWYKAYLVDAATHKTLTPSQQVIVELINPDQQILASSVVYIEDGGGGGDFQLAPDWESGTYLLRAYTSYQRNFADPFFFEKALQVYDVNANIQDQIMPDNPPTATSENSTIDRSEPPVNISFFPEGGDLVNGIATSVAVNASDQNMDGLSIDGTILTSGGDVVSRFTTHQSGLGFFRLIPKTGVKYYAQVNWKGEKINLEMPVVRDQGYVLQVKASSDTLLVTAQSSLTDGLNGGFIVGHLRGQLFGIVEGLKGNRTDVLIPTTNTPNGVVHFTLFTQDGMPVSERLVFVGDLGNQTGVAMALSADAVQAREEVRVNIKYDATSDQLLNGSITVTELSLATPHPYATNMTTYLLLESDLRGRIPNPAFFLEDQASNRRLLDILMMTHGWRRFEWDQLLQNPNVNVRWIPENSLRVRGYTTRYGNPKRPVKTNVFFSILSEDFSMVESTTNDAGEFEFTGFSGYDSIPILIQAELYKEKTRRNRKSKNTVNSDEASDSGEGPSGSGRWIDIFIASNDAPPVEWKNAIIEPPRDEESLRKYFAASRKTQVVDAAYQEMRTIELEEVVIATEKYDPVVEEHKSKMLYREPDYRMVADSVSGGGNARNVLEFIRGRIPGVEVVGAFPENNVRIRGANSIQGYTYATIVLDGIVVDVSLINTLPMERVAFIDVLKGLGKSAIYGTGGNGVIAIYTKSPGQMALTQKSLGAISFVFPGYKKANIFYAPDYSSPSDTHTRPDYRTTLYWNHNVLINGDQQRDIVFFVGDEPAVYSVRMEGITSDGQPVVMREVFEVK